MNSGKNGCPIAANISALLVRVKLEHEMRRYVHRIEYSRVRENFDSNAKEYSLQYAQLIHRVDEMCVAERKTRRRRLSSGFDSDLPLGSLSKTHCFFPMIQKRG
jgi:hypothetical protein